MESPIKDLPSTWALIKLGDFVENEKGKKPKNESSVKTETHQIPYVDIQAFEENVIRTWTDGVGCRKCYESDFLMVWDGSRSGLVGNGMNGALGSTLVRINFPSMVNKYAYYFLQSKYQQINTRAKGSGTPHVDPDLLWSYDFPIPPINEQHRIVAKIEELFSELDQGITNLKTAQAQLKVYRQALLKHAFEGKLTAEWRAQNADKLESASALQQHIQQARTQRYQQQLAEWTVNGKQGSKPKVPKPMTPLTTEELVELPELPEGWHYIRAGEVIDEPNYGTSKKCEYETKGIGVLRIPNIDLGKIDASDLKYALFTNDEIKAYKLETGDILIIRSNGSISIVGQCAIISKADTAFLYAGYLIRLRPIQHLISSHYFVTLLSSHLLRKQIELKAKSTSGVNNINSGEIQSLAIPICAIEEQEVIVEMLDSKFSEIDQLNQTITTSLQQAEALRQSILKKAFSGTLVAQDANDEPASVLLARIKAEKAAQAVTTKPRKTKSIQTLSEPAKTNVIPFPVKIPNISATDLHAGIIARAYQLHESSKRLEYYGHVKAEKISHLVESHLGIDLERIPFKDAAGPNDYPHLKKVESRACKAGWFEVRQAQKDGAYILTRLRGFDGLVNKTANMLGDRLSEVDALLKLLLPMNTRQAEIVATLYAGWNNLLLLGQIPSDDEIVHESRENWHTDKLNIERDKFFKALSWMREHGLIPTGKGRYVKNKEYSGK